MAIATVVNVHSGEYVIQQQKWDVTEIHIIKIHYCNILLIVIRSHFEIHDNQKQEINTVKISQYLLLRLCFSFCIFNCRC